MLNGVVLSGTSTSIKTPTTKTTTIMATAGAPHLKFLDNEPWRGSCTSSEEVLTSCTASAISPISICGAIHETPPKSNKCSAHNHLRRPVYVAKKDADLLVRRAAQNLRLSGHE